MNNLNANTWIHASVASAWYFGYPAAVYFLGSDFSNGNATPSILLLTPWIVGMSACFASWAARDAPKHGKSGSFAITCAVAWMFLFLIAMFFYLFATRGARSGARASLLFLVYCVIHLVAANAAMSAIEAINQ